MKSLNAKSRHKGRLRRLIELFLATTLIVSGALLLIVWEHPLSVLWDDPLSIFWDDSMRVHESGGRLWFMGPLLIGAGVFWIAEDWFGFGSNYSKDSALKVETPPALKQIDHVKREPLP